MERKGKGVLGREGKGKGGVKGKAVRSVYFLFCNSKEEFSHL